jgi:flagella basal body P-ring formation protein FlgA
MCIRLLLLILLSGLPLRPASAATLHLELRAAVLASQREVRLGSLAEIRSDDPALAQRVAELSVALTPPAGHAVLLPRSRLERVLRGRGVVATGWSGAQQVRIEAPAQSFDTAGLQAMARDHARDVLAAAGYRAEVTIARAAGWLQLPPGAVEAVVQPIQADALLRPRAELRLELSVDGAYFTVLAVPVLIRAWTDVLWAQRDLAAGQTLSCSDFVRRESDAATLGGVPAAPDCGAATQLATALPAGRALLASQLRRLPAVVQGQSVRLSLQEGGVLLESRAVALSDGAIGQHIGVRPYHARDAVQAEVVAPGSVQISRRNP